MASIANEDYAGVWMEIFEDAAEEVVANDAGALVVGWDETFVFAVVFIAVVVGHISSVARVVDANFLNGGAPCINSHFVNLVDHELCAGFCVRCADAYVVIMFVFFEVGCEVFGVAFASDEFAWLSEIFKAKEECLFYHSVMIDG